MEALRPAIQQYTDSLIDALPPETDFVESFAEVLPTNVICQLFGVPEADRRDFREWTMALFDTERDGAAGITNMNHYMVDLIEAKRANPADDLTTELLDGDHDLTDKELADTLMLLVSAGHETTVNMIGTGLLALLEHPDQLAELRERPELVPDAVEELLRFDSPVSHSIIRYPREDVEIAGTTIPEGEPVLLGIASANQYLPDLDITRPASKHLAFGHGLHYCIGAPLARLEGQVVFGTIARRLDTIELTSVPEWRTSLLMRGLRTLPVRLAWRA
jgi:cytochrome P450